MKTNKVLLWLAGIAGVLGLGYIAIKGFNAKSNAKKQDVKDNSAALQNTTEKPNEKPQVLPEDGSVLNKVNNALIGAILGVAGGWSKYKVTTKQTALNVRQKPDGASKIVASLPKDSIVLARSSKVMGWMEVSRDGKKSTGYSSSAFLTSAS